MSGMSPWNYGNFYMGNTTMQMIPYMKRKIAKFEAKMGMGGGCMPMMPCMPASCCMPMAAPMMAVAAPLPIAYNPLVQGMYPMVTANAPNFMTPSSFMSALTTGPMPYRPPASFELPNNIGMVMTVPYGATNPLLATPSFGGFSPQNNFGSGLSCCCCYCAPPPAPPVISYYPRPVPVPQPCPVPCPVPVPIPNIQQIPVPRPVTCVAPPILACGNQALSMGGGVPLMSSQGGFTQNGFGPTLVMASNTTSTTETLFKDETSEKSKEETSRPKSFNQSRRTKAQQIASSLSELGLNNNFRKDSSSSKFKNRIKSTRTSDNHSFDDFTSLSLSNRKKTSDSDWLTSDALSSLLSKSNKTRHRKSTRHHHRHSLLSDHDCVVCNAERIDRL
jgi:hypothetical protein